MNASVGCEERLRIVIFGVGAMGMLFGSRLSQVADVVLIGNWPAQIETVTRDDLLVTELDGAVRRYELTMSNQSDRVPPAQIVIILVKSYQTAAVAPQVAQVLDTGGVVVSLQNGVGNLETLAAAVGVDRVTQGVTSQGATMLAPGRLRHAGNGPTSIALLPGRTEGLARLVALLNQMGITTEVVDDVKGVIWSKLAVNAGLNPLTAIFELPNGALLEDEVLAAALFAAARETAAVAAAQGIRLPHADIAHHVAEIARATAANHSSMRQDVARGRPTEIDAMSGAVVRTGQQMGIATPINALLWQEIKGREAGKVCEKAVVYSALQQLIPRNISPHCS